MSSSEGKFLRQPGVGEVQIPLGLLCSASGDVFVADAGLNQIVVCRADGSFTRSFGHKVLPWRPKAARSESDEASKLLLLRPCCVAIDDAQGLVFVTNIEDLLGPARVHVFTLTGECVRSFGKIGGCEGEFGFCRGKALSKAGGVFVVDQNRSKILVRLLLDVCFWMCVFIVGTARCVMSGV